MTESLNLSLNYCNVIHGSIDGFSVSHGMNHFQYGVYIQEQRQYFFTHLFMNFDNRTL